MRAVDARQIDAASWLHDNAMRGWLRSDSELEALRLRTPGWSEAECALKGAAIQDLYSARVPRPYRLARHVASVMKDPPADGEDLVQVIACPLATGRREFSFASKLVHFFVDSTVPLWDRWARGSVVYHLGGTEASDWSRFVGQVARLRQRAGLFCSARQLDRYLWLSGQARAWLHKGKTMDSEVQALFGSESCEVRAHLCALVQCASWPASAEPP